MADPKQAFSRSCLQLDCPTEAQRIAGEIRGWLRDLRRQGVVVAMSGGIDSSVVAALCVRGLGTERVVGLLLPERESNPDSLRLGRLMAETLGIEAVQRDITATLESVGCYESRDRAIRRALPDYGPGWRSKIVLPSILESAALRLFEVVAEAPDGAPHTARLDASAYLQIVAAVNFKQRVRKMIEYYHADVRNYAVAGTPNRLEHDLGFFVKLGDGAADMKPIAHLYKSQVYELAEYLELPREIVQRPPTTDTYTLHQSQQEFYFSLPYPDMDLCLYGRDHDAPPAAVAAETGLNEEQVRRVYADIDQKRRTTRSLHLGALALRDQRT